MHGKEGEGGGEGGIWRNLRGEEEGIEIDRSGSTCTNYEPDGSYGLYNFVYSITLAAILCVGIFIYI